jgi:hypothetical protein
MTQFVRVKLPPVLRTVMGGREAVDGRGATVEAVLRDISLVHPELGLHFFDEAGAARRNIVCLHAGNLVRAKEFSAHIVNSGDEIVLTNALAGG